MSDTWIKLHRKITKNPVYEDSRLLHLFIHLLITASRFESQSVRGNSVITVNPGQVLTSRLALEKRLKMPGTTIERKLKVLEKLSLIGQQTDSNYRLITIANYLQYQESGQQTDNKRTLSRKLKKEKKDKDIIYTPGFEKFWSIYPPLRKGNKKKSYGAYKRALTRASEEEILEGAKSYVESNPGEYAKGCEAWLNDDRWTYDYGKAAKGTTDYVITGYESQI